MIFIHTAIIIAFIPGTVNHALAPSSDQYPTYSRSRLTDRHPEHFLLISELYPSTIHPFFCAIVCGYSVSQRCVTTSQSIFNRGLRALAPFSASGSECFCDFCIDFSLPVSRTLSQVQKGSNTLPSLRNWRNPSRLPHIPAYWFWYSFPLRFRLNILPDRFARNSLQNSFRCFCILFHVQNIYPDIFPPSPP